MDSFLETYSSPKLNQEETDQLNRPITRNEIEDVLKTPTTESDSKRRRENRPITRNEI